MGEKPDEKGKNEPSLELPSLSLSGFGRRKERKREAKEQGAVEKPPQHAAAAEPAAPHAERPHSDPDEPTTGIPEVREEPRQAVAKPSLAERFSLPALSGRVAAVVTGLVVGVFGTVLTYLAMMGCEVVKGTASCGRPGFFLLIGVLALMFLLGAALLKTWQVTDPGSTSFLAVGVLTVTVLVTLIEVVFSGWMFLLIPIISALAYALSHWVTTRFIEEPSGADPRRGASHGMDVR